MGHIGAVVVRGRRVDGLAIVAGCGGGAAFGQATLTTTAGDLELRIPKLRAGSFFPSLLERRRRIDQALGADIGISKSEVSRICADLDAEVAAFADHPLAEQAFP